MQVITPTPSQAALVLKKYFQEQGVDLEVSQMQEAVARMQGYASWNALAAAIDPRGAKPAASVIAQAGPEQYVMQNKAGTSALVALGPLTVKIKRDDEGVGVELLSTADLAQTAFADPVASSYAMFSDVEDEPLPDLANDPETQQIRCRQAIKELLAADSVLDNFATRNTNPYEFVYKRRELLLRALNGESKKDDYEVTAFEYQGRDGRRRGFALSHLEETWPDGKGSWVMPDEGVALRFLRGGFTPRARMSRDLLRSLKSAPSISLFYDNGAAAEDMPIEHLVTSVVSAYLNNKPCDESQKVLEYRITQTTTGSLTLGEVLNAHDCGDDTWLLACGVRMQVHAVGDL